MRNIPFFLLLVGAHSAPVWSGTPSVDPLREFSVIWTSPSEDSSGSMPLGNGEVGVNLWVEQDGDLLFYISRTDAWDEHARLVKLGLVRLRLSPNPFRQGMAFRQELRLRHGEVVIDAARITLRIWVDASRPVIWVEGAGKEPFDIEASLELWRTEKRTLSPGEANGVDGFARDELPVVYPDVVDGSKDDSVRWFHRNVASLFPVSLKLQGLDRLIPELSDPLLGRTFGGQLQGSGMRKSGPFTLKSVRPAVKFVVSVTTLTAQTKTVEEWRRGLNLAARESAAVNLEVARRAHRQWWDQFWERSWIRVSGGEEEETRSLSTGWHLNRYQNACAGRGSFPLKFNGSIFNVEGKFATARDVAGYAIPAGTPYDADYRDWGGCYWFQNTRHMFWPMLAAGDFDMLRPLFDMYRAMLPLSRERTRIYYGHDGAYFPETLYFWGAYSNGDLGYGWERQGKPLGRIDNGYTRYYWQSGLELLAMMLDYYSHLGDTAFARETLIPFADAVTAFYDQHYPRDASGKLRLEPANALETFWDVSNPTPEIAGLDRTLKGLLELPQTLIGQQLQVRWQRLSTELPNYPVKQVDGESYLDAAETIRDRPHNSENVAMWAVFPYRIFGVGRPYLDMIRNTYEGRPYPDGYSCWGNDNTSAAYLGLANEARKHLAERFLRHGKYRFPSFYTQGDWVPDLDNGGNAQQALQAMLMQADGRKIVLFPAWPKEWDVQFKLHAPFNTTVEGVYRGGKLERLKVTPATRRKDVLQLPGQSNQNNKETHAK